MAGGYPVYHSHCLLGLSAAGVTGRLKLMVWGGGGAVQIDFVEL